MSLKLLLDHNLSFRLLKQMEDLYPGSTNASREKLSRSDDQAVWEFAKRGNYLIVTQDVDFAERVRLFGPPPKVIWLRCGNTHTDHIATLLRQHHAAIKDFADHPQAGCLEVA